MTRKSTAWLGGWWGSPVVILAMAMSLCPSVTLADGDSAPADPGILTESDIAADPRYAEVEAAYRTGNLQKAEAILNAMLRDKCFALGMSARDAGQLQRAAIEFERVLILDPGHDRARAELARTYYDMGEIDLAKKEFRNVLKREPPEPVVKNIRGFLSEMKKGGTPVGWETSFSAGVLYDSNVNLGPDPTRIRISPIRFGDTTIDALDVESASRPKDDWGTFVHASASFHRDVGAKGGWGLVGGGELYKTWLSDHSDYDLFYAKAFGGARHGASRSLTDIPLAYEYVDQGGEGLASIYSLHPSHAIAASKTLFWITEAAVERRDYTDFDIRDSLYLEARETVRRMIGGERHSVSLSLAGFYEDSDAAIYDNTGFETYAAGEMMLPWDATLYLRLRYRGTWYDERETLAPEARQDKEWQASGGVNKDIGRSWLIDVGAQHTSVDSTFDLYEYDRDMLILSGSRKL